MRAIDFFCGAGGLTRGLLDAGIQVQCGVDADDRCKDTYENNNRPAQFCHADVCEVTASKVWRLLGSRRTSDLLIVGCAPCQPFSKHRRRGKESQKAASQDPDATLLGAFARLVEAILPAQVLVENVP